MSQVKLYLCAVLCQNVISGELYTFITPALEESDEQARHSALVAARHHLTRHKSWVVREITVSAIKRSVLEAAAMKILGWSKPSDELDDGEK